MSNTKPKVSIGQCTVEVIEASQYFDQKLLTLRLVYPRFIHSELMTHRVFSRNASSSRAIPAEKQIEFVNNTPVCPDIFTKTNKGMEAVEAWEDAECVKELKSLWKRAGGDAAFYAECISDKNVSKQVTNRLLEPFLPITTIVTSSKWSNFLDLRLQKNPDPQMQILAYCIAKAYNLTEFTKCVTGDMHCPFVSEEDYKEVVDNKLHDKYAISSITSLLMYISAARCARVSYLTRKNTSIYEDVTLAKRLLSGKHLSPFEHFAQASVVKSLKVGKYISNLNPIESIIESLLSGEDEICMWVQGRKFIDCYNNQYEQVVESTEKYFDRLSPYVKNLIDSYETKGVANA